jgi:Fe-S cluster assembly protein SufD
MSVAVMKTKAELAIRQGFEAAAGRLPGASNVVALRKRAMAAFEAQGLPHRRIEAWKYTDLRTALRDAPVPASGTVVDISASDVTRGLSALAPIDAYRIVFVDGRHAPAHSTAMPKGVTFDTLARALGVEGSTAAERLMTSNAPADEGLVALNAALVTDGARVQIGEGVTVDKPVLVVFMRSSATPEAVAVRNVIAVGNGARATLIEAHVSLPAAAAGGHAHVVTDIAVGDGAALAHVKVTTEATALHVATCTAAIGADATYRAFHLTAAPGIVRNQVFADFNGETAKLDISGAFLARGKDHVDTTLVVDHKVPHCESRELFKGVLDGEAKGVFQGKVIVRPDAQKSDGKQMAQALMLSPDAEFDSKPELEIYADDVVCGHGSTSAELDADLVFYCRSRGIPEPEARALLIESFVGEAIDKLEADPVREALRTIALGWLAAGKEEGAARGRS